MIKKVILFGATGFVGSAVAEAMPPGHRLVAHSAPRLSTVARSEAELLAASLEYAYLKELTAQLMGADVVINTAGNPDASSLDGNDLFGANALLPAILLRAATRAGVKRFVHVSSAVVQSDKPVLDSTEDMRPFSPYSASKVMGEVVVRALSIPEMGVIRFRPPSVHATGRRVTRIIGRIADSPLATVARPGDQGTPQALLPNVASAVAFIATTEMRPPSVIHHPSEGVTVSQLMTDLSGGRTPRVFPCSVARAVVVIAKFLGRVHRPTAANARRVELLWLGQSQAESWLTLAGWRPPVDRDGWRALGRPVIGS